MVKGIVERSKTNLKPLSLAFLDVRKAFDSVSWESLFKAAKRAGMPPLLVNYLKGVYGAAETFIVGSSQQRPIYPKRGVLQGDPMSGTLFNLVLDWCFSALPANLGVAVGSENVSHIIFADDTVLLSEDPVALQEILAVMMSV